MDATESRHPSSTSNAILAEAKSLLGELVSLRSVSSESNVTITRSIEAVLNSLGFEVEISQYTDPRGVAKANIVARRGPDAPGGLAYFCHSDVVPAADWSGPGGDPFSPVTTEDRIYGRGSCDMKGSLVAMLAAAKQVQPGQQSSPLWFVCTADEETGFAGAKHVVEYSPMYRQLVAGQPAGIIGEPTQLRVVHAHKGITGFQITSRGRAAHSSTAHGVNATLAMVPMLQTIAELERRTREAPEYRDQRFSPSTLSWNFGVNDHSTAINITPARCDVWVSLRTMPEIDGEDLITIAQSRANELGLQFRRLAGGNPLWVDAEDSFVQAMCALVGGVPETVCYSTDGGQFTELNQLLVCGPGDIAQAHTSDEWISLDQLRQGIDVYHRAILQWSC